MKHITLKFSKGNFPIMLIAISILTIICCCQKTITNDLVGKWSFEKDEDEFSGRYVHLFANDGAIYLIEYENKQDDFYKRKDKVGIFKIKENNFVVINWQNLTSPQEFKINKSEKGLTLTSNDGSKVYLIKTRQCYIDEKAK